MKNLRSIPRTCLSGTLAVLALVTLLSASPAQGGLATAGSKVAILDFFNLTGDAQYDEWEALFGRGLRRVLFTDPRVEVVRFPLIHSAIGELELDTHYITPEQVGPLAKKLSADLVVLGSFNVVGGVIAASLKVVDGKTGKLLQDDTRFGYEDQTEVFLKDLVEGLLTVLFSGEPAPTAPSGEPSEEEATAEELESEGTIAVEEGGETAQPETQVMPVVPLKETAAAPVEKPASLFEQAPPEAGSEAAPQVQFEGPGASIIVPEDEAKPAEPAASPEPAPANAADTPLKEEPSADLKAAPNSSPPRREPEKQPEVSESLEPEPPMTPLKEVATSEQEAVTAAEDTLKVLDEQVEEVESGIEALTRQLQETAKESVKTEPSEGIVGGPVIGGPIATLVEDAAPSEPEDSGSAIAEEADTPETGPEMGTSPLTESNQDPEKETSPEPTVEDFSVRPVFGTADESSAAADTTAPAADPVEEPTDAWQPVPDQPGETVEIPRAEDLDPSTKTSSPQVIFLEEQPSSPSAPQEEPALEPNQQEVPRTVIGPAPALDPWEKAAREAQLQQQNASPQAPSSPETGMVFVEELREDPGPPLVEGPVNNSPSRINEYLPPSVETDSPWSAAGVGTAPPAPSSAPPSSVQNVLDQAWNRTDSNTVTPVAPNPGASEPYRGRAYAPPQPGAPVGAPSGGSFSAESGTAWAPSGTQQYPGLPSAPETRPANPGGAAGTNSPWQPVGASGQPGGVAPSNAPAVGAFQSPLQSEIPRLPVPPRDSVGQAAQSPFQPMPAQPVAPPPNIPNAIPPSPMSNQTVGPGGQMQPLPDPVEQRGPLRRFGSWVGRTLGFGRDPDPAPAPAPAPQAPTPEQPPRQAPERSRFLWIFEREQSDASGSRDQVLQQDLKMESGGEESLWLANANFPETPYTTDVPIMRPSTPSLPGPEQPWSPMALPAGGWTQPAGMRGVATEPFPGPTTLSELGQNYFENGNYDLAEDTFRKAISQEPGNADLHYNLSQVYLATQRDTEAQAALEKAVEINSTDTQALDRLSALYAQKGEWGKAVDSLTQKALASPDDAETFVRLGMAFDQAGNPNQSVRAYKKALALDPRNAKAARNIASVYLKLGDRETAKPYIEMAKTLDASDPHLNRFASLAAIPGPSKDPEHGTLFTQVPPAR
jgi:Flp pilus assembly protein TadD